MKKKVIIGMCVLLIFASLTGCGNSQNNTENSTTLNTENLSADSEYANMKESNGFEFTSNGNGTCSISGIGNCQDKDIVIPEKSPSGDKVTKILKRAFYKQEDIQSIILAGRTLEIEENAFQSCEFEKLVINSSNLTVGKYAFSYCDNIKEILVSNSTVTVDGYAMYNSGKNINTSFANSTIELKKSAFQSASIATLKIENCTLNSDEYAFSYCDDIATVDIKGGIINFDSYAFYDSGHSAAVGISGCELTLEDSAFQSCNMINLCISNCKSDFGKYAFSYCKDLKTVAIGKGATEIDSYAFYDCSNLKEVSIGGESDSNENIITIKDSAFQSCGATSVSIAGGTTEIRKYGFSYCKDLTSVQIGKGSLKVQDYAFYSCSDSLAITYAGNSYNKESIQNVK